MLVRLDEFLKFSLISFKRGDLIENLEHRDELRLEILRDRLLQQQTLRVVMLRKRWKKKRSLNHLKRNSTSQSFVKSSNELQKMEWRNFNFQLVRRLRRSKDLEVNNNGERFIMMESLTSRMGV